MASASITHVQTSIFHRIRLSDENFAKLAEEVPPSEILDGLRSVFPPSNMWKVRYLGSCRYQVQGPEAWR
jgi:hypothetical protein